MKTADKKSGRGRGLIQVYTGDGKGKTTAALGLAVRAVGAGFRVAMISFDKGGDHYSERRVIAERFPGEIDLFATGLKRFDPAAKTFRFGVTPEDVAEAERGLRLAQELLAGKKYDLVILDEALTCVPFGLLRESDVLELLAAKLAATELVLTGRGCPTSIIRLADLVSEVRCLKHYHANGVLARAGLDH
ncbi:MAG: cob(I)yrinic acid a,c-diamide adenosyltransferase [Patescibacteria group bacterium]